MKHSVVAAQANTSPIMAALQDIAVDDFSGAAAQPIEKSLIIVSDMLENTRDYNQYRNLSDLSYQRFKQSPAYLKYRTDLHGARVTIEYIQRVLPTGLDTVRHIEFWKDWVDRQPRHLRDRPAAAGSRLMRWPADSYRDLGPGLLNGLLYFAVVLVGCGYIVFSKLNGFGALLRHRRFRSW